MGWLPQQKSHVVDASNHLSEWCNQKLEGGEKGREVEVWCKAGMRGERGGKRGRKDGRGKCRKEGGRGRRREKLKFGAGGGGMLRITKITGTITKPRVALEGL
jgi:hypothetical protein